VVGIKRDETGRRLKNEELPWQQRDHALFVGYAPVEKPAVAVSVLVQHGGGGARNAAPIGRAVMDKAVDVLKKHPYIKPPKTGEKPETA